VSPAGDTALAATVLALATVLATVVARTLPYGAGRRMAEDYGIVLGCSAPAIALLAQWLRDEAWAAAAVICAGYGGFYLIRTRQLRRADRDGVRRLLGLHRDASYGEVLQQVERLEPRPLTLPGRAALAAGAVVLVVAGALAGLLDAALVALALGAADTTVGGAYRRALARKVRALGR
jgi:hypothetical protein